MESGFGRRAGAGREEPSGIGTASEAPSNEVGIALYCQTVNKKETSVIWCLVGGATEFGMEGKKGDLTIAL
jgi:hypothetical protein